MNELIKKLIIRIWQNGRENRMPVCVTRATKLMYLIEWEYFAWTRTRLTSLDWIFLHYGPWSSELSDTLQKEFKAPPEEEQPDRFRPVYWSPPDFDNIDTKLQVELEGIIQRVLETFGAMPTKDIIRYVYFNTEPMQHAIRKQPLNFEVTRKPVSPFNPIQALEKNVRHELHDRLQEATHAKLSEEKEVLGDAPPEVLNILAKLDTPGDLVIPEGGIIIDDENKMSIAEEG